MRKVSFKLMLGAIALIIGASMFFSYQRKESKPASAPLVIRSVESGDSIPIEEAAIFLLNERDSMYDDCDCTQNVPVIVGENGHSLLGDLYLYSQAPATVLAYSPYHMDAKVDSIPWNLYWNDDLLVSDPCTATSHRNRVDLKFHRAMGSLCLFMDEEITGDVILEGDFPQEGTYNLLSGAFTVSHSEKKITLSDYPLLNLIPGQYKDVTISYGMRKYKLDIPITAGHVTMVTIDEHSSQPVVEVFNW